MSVFAISDLHLSGAQEKEMDVFGRHWRGHWDKIRADWHDRVTDDDLVLIPGDLSWAMRLEEAVADLNSICELPGTKLMLRGNHDYWWSSLTRVRGALTNNSHALQNDAFKWKDYVVTGSRCWSSPATTDEDKKIYSREVERLRLSVAAAKKLEGVLIGMTHYPPFNDRRESSEFTRIFAEAGVTDVVYGHLHGDSLRFSRGVEVIDGINYHLVSCDFLGFKLKQII